MRQRSSFVEIQSFLESLFNNPLWSLYVNKISEEKQAMEENVNCVNQYQIGIRLVIHMDKQDDNKDGLAIKPDALLQNSFGRRKFTNHE